LSGWWLKGVWAERLEGVFTNILRKVNASSGRKNRWETWGVKLRVLKNYFTLSDYTDFKKMIPQIFLYLSIYF
jgi:hypothetical protein